MNDYDADSGRLSLQSGITNIGSEFICLLASRKGRSDAGEEEETEDLAMAQETTAAE
ncbi:MAG: hypothetical protein RIF36_22520 [Imperialibacter sp.]|uniref:hypothetical protein n=1 Tax=Imperialibacter sp. TaxID=2038411 RepID=UPI0032EF25A8